MDRAVTHFLLPFRCTAFFFNETSSTCHFTAMAKESLIPYNKSSPMPKIYVNTKYQNCMT